jgi:hypothetical protein
MRHFLIVFFLLLAAHTVLPAQTKPEVKSPTIAEKTADAQKVPGYFTYYWDAKAGKIWMLIDKWETEFLYVNSLPTGVGSNDIGLDRGQLGQGRVVKFQRSGLKFCSRSRTTATAP